MNVTRPIALATLSVLVSACAEPVSPTSHVVIGTRSSVSPTSASILTVSPTSLTFGPTPVGTFDYEIVTISNSGDAADYISTVNFPTATPDPPFFPTFGGSCNTSIDPNDPNQRNYWIPAGGSCTFQWGFHPTTRGGGRPPWTATGSGTLSFDSGASFSIDFTGLSTPH
jgi:hypothetical protein